MKIELEGMRFRAYHGCLESERREGNDFEVDFVAQVRNCVKAATSDRLEDSLDYSKIYEIVAAEMQIPSNLMEHVAGRIIRSAAAAYPQFGDICVRVSKACPPVDGECRWSRVSLSREEMGI